MDLFKPESHKVFRQVVENMRLGIFMADNDHRISYVNNAFAETFGLRNAFDVLGKTLGEACFSNADQYAQFTAKLNAWGTVKDFPLAPVPMGGKTGHLLLTIGRIYSEAGEAIGLHGFLVDASGLHRQEEDNVLQQRRIEQILGFCNSLDDIFHIEELTDRIVQETAQILDAKRCSLMLVDGESNELYVNACCGFPGGAPKARVRIGQPVAGLVALQGKAVLVDDIEYEGQFKSQNKKTYTRNSFMSAPIFYSKRLMGVLNVSERDGHFNASDLKMLETIAQQSALNINKTKTLSTFEQLSLTDPMTGLLNYRSFTGKLDEEIYRAGRYGLPLSLMMIDLDNFKKYNDLQGHPEGNRLLRKVAEVFKANLRATELICRYGGDEFAIILPQTDAAQAVIAAEKIRAKAAREFGAEGVSISVGVVQLQTGDDKENLIKRADQAMYLSKNSGRNRVTAH